MSPARSLVYADRKGALRFRWMSILEQDRIWIDRWGDEHPIEEMSEGYRANAARWLRERVGPKMKQKYDFAMALAIGAYAQDHLGQEAARLAEEEFDFLMEQSTEDWIEEFPLYQALVR